MKRNMKQVQRFHRGLRLGTLAGALALSLGLSAGAQAQAPQVEGAVGSAGAAGAATTPALPPQAQEGPEATIKRAVDGVTSTINGDKSIQSGNRARINALVDNKIMPFVNPERMTQTAVGPNWAKATPEQKSALIQEFKTLMTNTYAGAFSSYRPETQIQYKPTRVSDDSAVVRSMVVANGRDPIPIDYYLEKEGAGWKVVDLSVYGARLVELYKTQFNTAIASGGVDGLIRDLKAKNAGGVQAKS